ncbi:MAG: hypothetical protein QM803_14950 [Rhodocyclaceae bacterium]
MSSAMRAARPLNGAHFGPLAQARGELVDDDRQLVGLAFERQAEGRAEGLLRQSGRLPLRIAIGVVQKAIRRHRSGVFVLHENSSRGQRLLISPITPKKTSKAGHQRAMIGPT